MLHLDRLPPELVQLAASTLDYSDLAAFALVSKRCYQIVKNSSSIQYALHLKKLGLRDQPNSSFTNTSSARLDALIAYRKAWRDFVPIASHQRTRVELKGDHWELLGNVLGNYNAASGFTFHRVPCPLRNIPYESWTLPTFSGKLVDFSMDFSQDLLVVVASTEQLDITVHLLSLRTGHPHPSARLPQLARQADRPYRFGMCQIRISGDFVGYMGSSHMEYRGSELFVWQWKTGSLKKSVFSTLMTSFAFLDATHILVSTFIQKDWSGYSYRFVPLLQIVAVDGATLACAPSLTLELPAIHLSVDDVEMSVLTEPAPTWPAVTLDWPFSTSHEDRLFVVSLECQQEDADRPPNFLLCVRLATIFGLLEQTSESPVPWDEWGPSATRMLRIPRSPDPWVCYVYGTRCVIQSKRDMCQVLDFKELYDASDHRIMHEKSVDNRRWLFEAPVVTNAPFSLQTLRIPASHAVLLSEDAIITVSPEEDQCTILSVG